MKLLYSAAAAAVMTLSLAGVAGAVDLHDPTNSDYQIDYNRVTVTENGQTRQIDLRNGEIVYDICKSCTIKLDNGQSIEASEFDMVETNGSSLKVYKFPRTIEKRS
jgi:hypothetical protein